MFLVVGIGNIGAKYENTRHNLGFRVLENLALEQNLTFKLKFNGEFALSEIYQNKVVFLMPHTFVNESGKSVFECKSFYKIENQKIIVVYDDFSLNLGKIRIRERGSSGGHNGIKSIIEYLNDDHFARIKIGIRNKKLIAPDPKEFVLSDFTSEEIPLVDEAIKNVTSAVIDLITNGITYCMNNYSN